jgi:hypothetical protein
VALQDGTEPVFSCSPASLDADRAGDRVQAVKMAPQGEAETDREAAKAMGHEHHGSGLHIRERIKGLFGGGSSSKKEE